MAESVTKENNIFITILILGCLISLAVSFYFFSYKKEYDFLVEASCDSSSETCFYRDCVTNESECPPNNLSYYSKYTIRAKDFPLCLNGDCTQRCASGLISCKKTICTESDLNKGICVLPNNNIHE